MPTAQRRPREPRQTTSAPLQTRSQLGFAKMLEAGRALIANARDTLRIDRMKASHFLDNPASGRVLAKLGFRPTGVTRPRYSAARRAEVPCREFALDLSEADVSPDLCPIAA